MILSHFLISMYLLAHAGAGCPIQVVGNTLAAGLLFIDPNPT